MAHDWQRGVGFVELNIFALSIRRDAPGFLLFVFSAVGEIGAPSMSMK